MKTSEMLARIDAAMQRMRRKGHYATPGYACLLAKRRAVADGNPYKIVDVAEVAIKSIAAQIPQTNISTKGRPIVDAKPQPYTIIVQLSLWCERSALPPPL